MNSSRLCNKRTTDGNVAFTNALTSTHAALSCGGALSTQQAPACTRARSRGLRSRRFSQLPTEHSVFAFPTADSAGVRPNDGVKGYVPIFD